MLTIKPAFTRAIQEAKKVKEKKIYVQSRQKGIIIWYLSISKPPLHFLYFPTNLTYFPFLELQFSKTCINTYMLMEHSCNFFLEKAFNHAFNKGLICFSLFVDLLFYNEIEYDLKPCVSQTFNKQLCIWEYLRLWQCHI